MEKRAIPSLKGMRPSADMAATLSRGGMDGLNEHTYQTAIVCRVFTVWILSLHTVYAMAAACGAMGLDPYSAYAIASNMLICEWRHIGIFGNRRQFRPAWGITKTENNIPDIIGGK